MFINFLLVGFGAGLGAMLRYGISIFVKSKWKTNFPFATFFINITGSFLLGFLVSSALGPDWQLFLGTGFMGGYTTFSTFKVESMELKWKTNYRVLFSYLSCTYVFGLVAAFIGIMLGI
ncbi:fluoride efflux transporter CrcB [Listeria monocytogenes]|uniref:fluoride efflux transporter CrcB n=1 Tax=Listeria monocytogenes TaxID=1639 RepID=UPI000F1E7FBA|nr:fluoride efflux transporter CrcB [Listeria monocytogenes]EAC9043052.1 fluoride efflux transporter CrcB [Listeria monocytogenes]EAD2760648.1 fluoride efflux transporter CrcB [Listeria monocytogenes]EAD3286062.1 fluoride efflux transporter CrcB [Listeria monocytogenes]EAE2395627.1 fluoride efflux transporter CrcB [Listeria monocytogenes]EAG2102227.1 fluoride efflux transporter CrcB [Listeria monocytogenes]